MSRMTILLTGLFAATATIGCEASDPEANEPNAVTPGALFESAAGEVSASDESNEYFAEREHGMRLWGFYRFSREEIIQCLVPPCEERIFIEKVNRDATTCLDGGENEECLVRNIELATSGTDREVMMKFREVFARGYGIAEGWMQNVQMHNGEWVETLFVATPWVGVLPEEPASTVYEVRPADIVCFRAPCPKFYANVLNTEETTLVHRLDLESAGVDETLAAKGRAELERGSILVPGDIWEWEATAEMRGNDEPLPGSKILSAQTFYLPLRARE